MTKAERVQAIAERKARFLVQMKKMTAAIRSERDLVRRCDLIAHKMQAIQAYGNDIGAICR